MNLLREAFMDTVLTLCYKHYFEVEKELDILEAESSGKEDYTTEQKINRYHILKLLHLLEAIIKARIETLKERE